MIPMLYCDWMKSGTLMISWEVPLPPGLEGSGGPPGGTFMIGIIWATRKS